MTEMEMKKFIFNMIQGNIKEQSKYSHIAIYNMMGQSEMAVPSECNRIIKFI